MVRHRSKSMDKVMMWGGLTSCPLWSAFRNLSMKSRIVSQRAVNVGMVRSRERCCRYTWIRTEVHKSYEVISWDSLIVVDQQTESFMSRSLTLLSSVDALNRVSSIPPRSVAADFSNRIVSKGNKTLLKHASHSTADNWFKSWTSSALCSSLKACHRTSILVSVHSLASPGGNKYHAWWSGKIPRWAVVEGIQVLLDTYGVLLW